MTPESSAGATPPATPPPGKPGTIRDPIMTLVLMMVTCGIYPVMYIYQTTTEIQDFTGEHDMSPALETALCFVTCGLYAIYWYYKYFNKIPQMQAQVGRPQLENPMMWFILMFVPIANWWVLFQFQTELNAIWTAAGAQPA